MTADQKFTLLIAGLGLIFSVLTVLLGLIWRSGRTSGQVTTQLQNLVEDVGKIATSVDEHIKWHLGGEPPAPPVRAPSAERRTRRPTRPRSQADPTG